jgi:type IX secretion system PorP/SprF family membrane protein
LIKFEIMAGKQLMVFLLALGMLFIGVKRDVQAQDPQFSQFYNAPLYLNPSFTGATNSNRVIINHRLQWPNLPQTFATYTISYDIMRPELRSGFGILISTDKAGSAALRNTNVNLMYAYKIQYDDRWVITPSIYFGYGLSSIDLEKLLLGDQLEFDNGTAPTLVIGAHSGAHEAPE